MAVIPTLALVPKIGHVCQNVVSKLVAFFYTLNEMQRYLEEHYHLEFNDYFTMFFSWQGYIRLYGTI